MKMLGEEMPFGRKFDQVFCDWGNRFVRRLEEETKEKVDVAIGTIAFVNLSILYKVLEMLVRR